MKPTLTRSSSVTLRARSLLTLASVLGLAGAGCSDLDEVPVATCGNLVVEAGEQCDGAAGCGSEGLAACRFTCERAVTACPGELACSVEGVCTASTNRFVSFADAPRLEMPTDRLVVGDLDGDLRDDVIGVGESLRVRFGAVTEPLQQTYEKQIRPPTGPATIGQLDGRRGLDVVFPTADGVFTLVSRGRELDAVPYASTQTMPDDVGRACAETPPGWAACRVADLNRDGWPDQVGFVRDRDNLEIELGRAAGAPVGLTLDTIDVITDVTTGDFDGDAYGDIGFSTRSINGLATSAVHVVYGAPQPAAFATTLLLSDGSVTGVAAGNIDGSLDGLDDLAVSRTTDSAAGVAVYLGDAARDLSAPFRLDGVRTSLDVPYALVAGEFVGGENSGIDVMAYARNPADPDKAYLWWLRGLGAAQLEVGAIDTVDSTRLAFRDRAWTVADLVTDLSATANGPDEVIGLSPVAPGCAGPAITAAVPSARFTSTELLRSACLDVEGSGWQPALIGLVDQPTVRRAVALAQRQDRWWVGQADRLDDATTGGRLAGQTFGLDSSCRDPQLWQQAPGGATLASWVCDGAGGATVVQMRAGAAGEAPTTATLSSAPAGASHVTGDFNGDGLTDLALRQGRVVAVMLQCSTDMVGTTPGC